MHKIRVFFLIGVLVFSGYISGRTQTNSVVSEVFEYCPAPGQFVNTTIGGPAAANAFLDTDQGFITLGGFGGFIIFKLEKPIENNPKNPYGIDFSLFGNATNSSAEPAAVWILADSNLNGLPDETWLLLAGSDYWFSTSKHNYEITYSNQGSNQAGNVAWTDNEGNSGFIFANEYHSQPYYPLADSFPEINQSNYSLKGENLYPRIDTSNPMLIVTRHYPFGYADNKPKNLQNSSNLPDNPYTDSIEGMGGDSFDLSWAIDNSGNYLTPEKADFIKIQNVVNFNFGRIGELSTELTGIVAIEPQTVQNTDTLRVVLEPVIQPIYVGQNINLNAFYFEWGRYEKNKNFNWSVAPESLADIDQNGQLIVHESGTIMVTVSVSEHKSLKDSIQLSISKNVVVFEHPKPDYVVYPNPVQQILYLPVNQPFAIWNILGKIMMQGVALNGTLDVTWLQNGVYFIGSNCNQKMNTQKFIKN